MAAVLALTSLLALTLAGTDSTAGGVSAVAGGGSGHGDRNIGVVNPSEEGTSNYNTLRTTKAVSRGVPIVVRFRIVLDTATFTQILLF